MGSNFDQRIFAGDHINAQFGRSVEKWSSMLLNRVMGHDIADMLLQRPQLATATSASIIMLLAKVHALKGSKRLRRGVRCAGG
jgi:hypothetical protein